MKIVERAAICTHNTQIHDRFDDLLKKVPSELIRNEELQHTDDFIYV